MKEFFLNQNLNFKIEIFSISHIILMLLTLFLLILIFKNRKKLRRVSSKTKKIIRIIFAIFLIINMFIRRGSFIYYGVYDWRYHLDINFCNFTSILFIIYGLTGNKKIYNICYYFAFVGPLLSIIFPSTTLKPFTYSFYSFILIHHILFIFNYMFMYFENYEYSKSNFYKAIIFMFIYFLTTYCFNILMSTNYNNPLTFVNNDLLLFRFFSSLINNKIFSNIIFMIIVYLFLLIGKLSLKNSNK